MWCVVSDRYKVYDMTMICALMHIPEQLHEVMELAMDITTDSNGALHGLHVGLFYQYLPCLVYCMSVSVVSAACMNSACVDDENDEP